MTIIEIAALPNGAHRNQTWYDEAIPEGWALIPDDMVIPDSFPFVGVVAEEITYYREVERTQEVTKTREIPTLDEEATVTEEYTETETVVIMEPYTRMEVVEMTEGVMPEPQPGILDNPVVDITEAMAAAIQEGVESV